MPVKLIYNGIPNRFDVEFGRSGIDYETPTSTIPLNPVEGWVEMIDGVYQGFTPEGPVGEPHADPVQAAKFVISNYEVREMQYLERAIADAEGLRDKYEPDSLLRKSVERLIDGMKSRLATGDL